MKQDFEGTLAKVAQAGYREVEFAGYFDKSPQEVRTILDHHGLKGVSSHVGDSVVAKSLPETLEAAHTIGQGYVVCSSIGDARRKEPDGWKHIGELFNQAGSECKKAGIQFAYHNHTFEFQPDEGLGGKMPYDVLLAETDPKLVQMEMDIGWITEAGQDPVDYFNRYPGRFPLVHVKDFTKDHKMMNVGSGAIDWKRIFAQSDKGGIKHYFVEHDQPKAPFDDIKASYQYIAKLRF
jgi:sugar phosphate isomerase/epimerase